MGGGLLDRTLITLISNAVRFSCMLSLAYPILHHSKIEILFKQRMELQVLLPYESPAQIIFQELFRMEAPAL